MFKITQNTQRSFTLAEVLLMAAMNQLEATRKAFGNEGSQLNRCPYRAEADFLARHSSVDVYQKQPRHLYYAAARTRRNPDSGVLALSVALR
jgi:hypothetical protein